MGRIGKGKEGARGCGECSGKGRGAHFGIPPALMPAPSCARTPFERPLSGSDSVVYAGWRGNRYQATPR